MRWFYKAFSSRLVTRDVLDRRMASTNRLCTHRRKSFRCTLTLMCFVAALIYLLGRENVSVAEDETSMAITGNLRKTVPVSSQITIPSSEPKTISKHKADITRSSTRIQAVSDPILRYLSITQNRDVWDNMHMYKFSMNVDSCKGGAPVIVIVHTAMHNVQKRQKIRKGTSGQETLLIVVFLVGETTNASLQAEVEKESQKYQDIVQGNFIDSYHNLTHKHIMGYHWVINHCKNVRYFIKIDDDVVVHIDNVLRYLLLNPLAEGHIMCHVENWSEKKTAGKWAISELEYPFIRYPRYCAGFAYITTLSVVKRLHAASTYIKTIWIDDVYATGLLAFASNTTLIGFPRGQHYSGMRKPPARFETEGMFVLYRN